MFKLIYLTIGLMIGREEELRGITVEVNLLKKVRLEIAVNQEYLERTIEAIIEGTRIE